MQPNSLSHPLTQFALEQSAFDALPPAVVAVAKEMMVNAAAVGLAGAAQAEGQALTRFVQEMGGNGRCTIIGKGLRTSPVYAALANGVMIHLLDFDDEIIPYRSHPSSVIFPVVMALGEMHGGAGPDVLAAFVLGCEVTAKLEAALGPDAAFSDVAGAIGAAVAAGRLLGLDAAGLEQAVSRAGVGGVDGVVRPAHHERILNQAHHERILNQTHYERTLNQAHHERVSNQAHHERTSNQAHQEPVSNGPGTAAGLAGPGRAYRQGRAAMQGVMAALLSRPGLAESGDLAGGRTAWDADRMTDFCAGLGNPYAVINPGVSLKLYPCAAPAHPAIDAALQLAQQYRIDPDGIESVQVAVTPAALAALPFPTPGNGGEARFCLSYIVAAALTYGHPLIDSFTDAAAQDGRVRGLMDRVAVEATERASGAMPYPCSLALTLRDGRQLRHRVEVARGQPELPLSPEELDAKFLYCSRYILPPDHIEEAITRLRELENIENTTGLFSVLGG